MQKRMLFTLLFFVSCSSFSKAHSDEFGIHQNELAKPLATKTVDLGVDSETNNQRKMSCYQYPNFTIVELDNGDKGAAGIEVHFTEQASSTDFCTTNFNGNKISITPVDGYFLGILDQYLFVRGADSVGTLMDLNVYDVNSGKKIFTTSYNMNKKMNIKTDHDKLTLSYYQPLKVTCTPINDKKSECWNKILKTNNIESNYVINPPDCRRAIKELKKANPEFNSESEGLLQISTKVMIDDAKEGTAKYLRSKTTCDMAP